ncbi:MAG: cyclic nucleotide-binding domain-containing protein [Desulfomonilia bacterium]|jgi:CRP-like cAMP-binding protein|uniref:Cyclic nucleotide-gated potassium channel n=1 Tax=anaerobic digester metagenome TaxID=1263854 RepID=A0A485M7T9_9ZZZZ|nr:cyclic nucleotide-binding domain-containing protein [Pseudomonadota bacterium]HON63175.1 cyclic nucleotide-binding domain-containing protein [Deltaproteobacteria bacterium]HPD22271.1 cyclic nucleotide-binding domain-containing protein [Deltaproteobacteria bacterium]HRS57123.1 cyclic nucleotide-binding domain-containing protein [Desulfomonilia bacterium]HRV36772.1 cyclic nucleotide-binding domain-containing protein [Desulfomonilia bacterium]
MLESQYLTGRDDLLDTIKKIPFLRSYEDKFLRKILELSKLRRYGPGEVITREGEYDCWLYVILAGEVKVVKGDEEIARLDARGGTFGELAVIDGKARSASIFSLSETTCLAIDGSIIDRLEARERQEFEAVYFRLLSEILAHRLRQTSSELSRLKQEMELMGGN